MTTKAKGNDITLKQAAAITVAALVGLFALGFFDPLPEPAQQTDGVFLYYGAEGETVVEPNVSGRVRAAAEDALETADYFGAFAVGPGGKQGVWTSAWTADLARSYALAACGQDCRVVAERLPRYRDASRSEPIATTAMARNLAVKWPFTKDYVAIGGAGAWGHRSKPAGKTGWKRAMREAAADCERRRAAEPAPEGVISLPCRVGPLREIEDLRPRPELYPADYTVDLATLAPVAGSENAEVPGGPHPGWLRGMAIYLPPRLHGARAANGASSFEVARGAGWPEAGKAIALEKCNAERRPGEDPCAVTHTRVPDQSVPAGALAVTPKLFEAYSLWEQTQGAGAFAVSPYGPWGHSHGMTNAGDAMQKAADWCWYYTRKSWEYRQVDRAFLEAGVVCRIVAVREK